MDDTLREWNEQMDKYEALHYLGDRKVMKHFGPGVIESLTMLLRDITVKDSSLITHYQNMQLREWNLQEEAPGWFHRTFRTKRMQLYESRVATNEYNLRSNRAQRRALEDLYKRGLQVRSTLERNYHQSIDSLAMSE